MSYKFALKFKPTNFNISIKWVVELVDLTTNGYNSVSNATEEITYNNGCVQYLSKSNIQDHSLSLTG